MKTKSSIPTNTASSAAVPLFRRFAALIYDSFIVFSWLLLATTLALILNRGQSLRPYQGLFLTYLFSSTGLLLSWFWMHGQTLGMLAWKIKMIQVDGRPLSFSTAFKRYVLACLSMLCAAIGLWWCFIDKDKQSLYDRLSKTRLIKV